MSSSCDHPGLAGMQRVSRALARSKLARGSFVRLPNELVESILTRFDVQTLIHLRLVCKRWQNVIENIDFNKQKSLILMDYAQTDTFREALTRRFFGEIDLNTFAYLKLKRTRDPETVEHFRALLLKLFPVISQLVIAFWTVSDPAFVFNLWPSDQLTTLSFNMNGTLLTNWQMEQLLPRMITSFTHLKRLDLDTFYEMLPALAPNLTNLEHLSCSHRRLTYRAKWASFMSRFMNRENLCTRFWIQSVKASYEVLDWHRVSGGHWLNRLTHLALFINSSLEQVVDYLSVQASSLRVLHLKHNVTNHDIFRLDSRTVRHLSRLVHLMELELDWVSVNVLNMERATQERQLAALVHIQIFRLTIYRIDGNNREASDRLMRTLSMIVPNVEQLTIAYYCADQLANIELYLRGRFAHLREHEFVHLERTRELIDQKFNFHSLSFGTI